MKKTSLLVIFLVVLIDLIGFGIVIPILPYYALKYGASGLTIGWLMMSYSLMQFLVAPLWGRLSDRIGRRPVLLISMLGSCASLTLLGFASSLEWLFIGRVLAGICGANISTAYAYIADITTEKDRAKGMGLIGASFGIGFILGPAIGGVLSVYGYGAPMLAAAGLAGANFILASVILGEPLQNSEARAAKRSRRPGLTVIGQVLSYRPTGLPIALFFIFTLAVTQMEVTFAIFLKHMYGFDARMAGYLLAMIGFIMALIQGGLIGKLSKRFGEYRLILGGSLFCAAGLLIFGMTSVLSVAVLGLLFLAIGHGVLHPALSSLTSLGAQPSEKGVTMGVFHSASSFARVVGPPTAGFLYDSMNPRAPFLSGTFLVFTVFVILAVGRSPERNAR